MAGSEGADENGGVEGRVRASATDIYERVKREAGEEIDRPVAALAFSGLLPVPRSGSGRSHPLLRRPPWADITTQHW